MSYVDGYYIFDSDFNKILEAFKRNGVIYGLQVSAGGAGDRAVTVSAGMARVNGKIVAKTSPVTLNLAENTSSYPRKDIIVIDSSGSIVSIQGATEAAYPTDRVGAYTKRPRPPNIPENTIILAEVWVEPGVTSFTSEDITDRRVFTFLFNKIIYVEDYNASTDKDTIQNALNAIPDAGAIVVFPPRTFTGLEGLVIPKSNVLLAGCGASTILKLKNSASNDLLLVDGKSNIALFNLTFDGNKSNQTELRKCLYFYGGGTLEHFRIQNCIFRNCQEAIRMEPDATSGFMKHIFILNNLFLELSDPSAIIWGNYDEDNGRYTVQNITIQGNQVYANATSADNGGKFGIRCGENVQIRDNIFVKCTYGIAGRAERNFVVENNLIVDCQAGQQGAIYFMPEMPAYFENVFVINNKIIGCGYHGIYINAIPDLTVNRIVIAENKIFNCNQTPIYVNSTFPAPDQIHIFNNILDIITGINSPTGSRIWGNKVWSGLPAYKEQNDWTLPPESAFDGDMIVIKNTSTGASRLYVRSGGEWKYVDLT